MAFRGPPHGAATRGTVEKASRQAPTRPSDDNDGGASAQDLADFTQFGEEILEGICRKAGEIESACSSFEMVHGMPPGGANLDVVKALMRGREARSGRFLCDERLGAKFGMGEALMGEAAMGTPLWYDAKVQDLDGIVVWSGTEEIHKQNVQQVYGLRCIKNKADGNCFFESLQQLLQAIGHVDASDSVSQIRNKLVDALDRARDEFMGFMSSDEPDLEFKRFDLDDVKCRTHEGILAEWARYISHLRGNGVWANNFLVTVVPVVYGVELNCFLKTSMSQVLWTYSPLEKGSCPEVFMYCNNRHYEAMEMVSPSRDSGLGTVSSHSTAHLLAEFAETVESVRKADRLQSFAKAERRECREKKMEARREARREEIREENRRAQIERESLIQRILVLLPTTDGPDRTELLQTLDTLMHP
jgi:hypothetical protein